VCVYAECTHHADRGWTRLMSISSDDRGRSWGCKVSLAPETHGTPYWNCPRIVTLADGTLLVTADMIHQADEAGGEIWLMRSHDEGASWSAPEPTPARGIVPDRLCVLADGRWLLTCHDKLDGDDYLSVRTWISDDGGAAWQPPVTVARQKGLQLCEASLLELGDALVCFMRENSGLGLDCFKAISRDRGQSWSAPITFPLPACHRPTSGQLADGRILITYRMMQGGLGWVGWWTQNTLAGLSDVASALAPERHGAHTRILPLDYDRSPHSDTGYTGWVQLDDGEIYIVNYIVDDAPKGQIRGYALRPEEFLLDA